MITPPIHSDTDLVFRWLANLPLSDKRFSGQSAVHMSRYRWTAVQDMFAIGATSAKQVCLRHGFEPDEMVRKT